MTQAADYPVQLSVDYPDRPLDRFSTFFRILLVIPIAVIVGLLGGGDSIGSTGGAAVGLLFLPLLLMILFRRKYPRWWFDWNLALVSFSNRVTAYLFLLRDEYPSTDEEQAVHLTILYPEVDRDLRRFLPLVKWLLAIPHYIILSILGAGALIAILIAWFAILFTGRYPLSLFNFVVSVMRWSVRVQAYAFLLVTDEYPPFRLDP